MKSRANVNQQLGIGDYEQHLLKIFFNLKSNVIGGRMVGVRLKIDEFRIYYKWNYEKENTTFYTYLLHVVLHAKEFCRSGLCF